MQTEIERIEALIASERVADAVALLSETRAPLGYQLIERTARDGHRLGRLAKVFYEARSFRMVALCFEQVGFFSQAGKMYLKANDALSAAEMWRDGQDSRQLKPMSRVSTAKRHRSTCVLMKWQAGTA